MTSVAAAIEAATLPQAFAATAAAHPDRVAFRTKDDEVSFTWAQYADQARELAAGLAGLGVKRGDTVALMLVNRPEFHVWDAAAMHLGATCFSIYNTSSPEQVDYVLSDSRAKVLITERQFVASIRNCASGRSEQLIVIDEPEEGELSPADVLAAAQPGFDVDAAVAAIAPDDVLCLIYTSGTTGPPKGVQITHHNWMCEARAFEAVASYPDEPRMISYLPMAHVAERGLLHYQGMVHGVSATCCDDPKQLAAYLPSVRPTMFGGVPRVWEKLKAALEAGFADKLEEARVNDDQAFFAQLRGMLGLDEVHLCVGGAAAIPVEVLEFFAMLGIEILELWGMSETSAVATMNPPGKVKIGTVGPPLPGVEVKLEADGEILVRGETITKGYRNLPGKTAEAFTPDGWLLTGDIGEFDEDGYLKIVDRKKELIINAAGKNMSPANIEARLKTSSPLIGQAFAYGDGKAYNVALITLDPDVRAAFVAQHGEDAIGAEVAKGVERANGRLARVEQIKKFEVLDGDWLPGGDELTPTMKLKRRPIVDKYGAEIDALYE